METLFESEVKREKEKCMKDSVERITEQSISALPEPLQRYFRHCGYVGANWMNQVDIKWEDFFLKMSPTKGWLPLKCRQMNFVTEPSRIVYMKGKLKGFIPFEGRDKYQDGQGNLLIKLAKLITVGDAKGKEMDEGEVVTFLAESLLVPSTVFQEYLSWYEIDSNHVKGILTHHGKQVSGVFTFRDNGEFVRFDTDDRYMTEGKTFKKIGWSAMADDYREKNGIRFPTKLRGVWHLENEDFEYFKGTIAQLHFQ